MDKKVAYLIGMGVLLSVGSWVFYSNESTPSVSSNIDDSSMVVFSSDPAIEQASNLAYEGGELTPVEQQDLLKSANEIVSLYGQQVDLISEVDELIGQSETQLTKFETQILEEMTSLSVAQPVDVSQYELLTGSSNNATNSIDAASRLSGMDKNDIEALLTQ